MTTPVRSIRSLPVSHRDHFRHERYPVPVADSYTTGQNTTLNVVAGSGLLFNDTDVDFPVGPPLTVSQINGLNANIGVPVVLSNGTLTVQANGALTYVPFANVVGYENFTYTVTDGNGQCNRQRDDRNWCRQPSTDRGLRLCRDESQLCSLAGSARQ